MPSTPRPRVFVSYANDSDEHTDAVHRFAARLRGELGVDVRFDLWERDRRRDWQEWAVRQIEEGDFVLAIASPRYKRLARPDSASLYDAASREEAVSRDDAAFQLVMLREHLAVDRPRWLPKILPVILPGYSADDLPAFLQPYTATRYVIPAQLDELLRVLTGQPRDPLPGLGPSVDPATLERPGLFRATPIGADLSRVLVDASERLAGAVSRLWKGEADRLGLTDPRPLATPWRVGGEDVDRFGEFYRRRVPTGRLLVLGGPGSGKSVSAIRLVSGLLAGWTRGDPVPVLVPVTDWHPGELHAFDWLARRLARDHRLGRTVRWVDGRRTTLASALLEVGLVLPVLDGLETIADDLRADAIEALNRLGSWVPLVVTCGSAQYRALEAAGVGLTRVTRAELRPLAHADVEDYLTETLPHGVDRLAPLFARLRDEPRLTPLTVWLIRAVHRRSDRDPAALGDRERFPDLDAHLLADLLPAVYPDHPEPGARSSSTRRRHPTVRRWLALLVDHLEATGSADIAWWRLDRVLPWVAPGCRVLGGASLGLGLTVEAGPVAGLVAAAAVGALAGSRRYLRRAGVRDLETPHALHFTAARVRSDVAVLFRLLLNGVLVIAGLSALLVAALGLAGDPPVTVRSVLVLSALTAGGGFLVWRFGRAFWRMTRADDRQGMVGLADLDRPTSPGATVRADRAVLLLGTGTMLGLAAVFAVVGVRYAVWMCLGYAAAWAMFSAYTRFTVARLVLASRGQLAWRLMAFLDEARDRGVLRQYGAVHQFRHQALQKRLTDRRV
ncbi:SEFIR domain-containing protein [Saccharothrix australiensis]|uniref:SEFIR domain-containing protein n=1 Tax=Saccharothrix australiensis TaxID=2072 RepID=A0A495W1L5_9PSEU|nr:SEFIR domain-containing protein [Saccharothrix australiensis]RKT55359.1 SEFIR domain-containing protein [Saccharothrix australiensis]